MRGSQPFVTQRSRSLRHTPTDAEIALWRSLRNRALNGYKFVRQVPIGAYFADFLCREHKLIVEVDGSQHEGSEYDAKRDEWLVSQGYSVLRVWNIDAIARRDSVLETIVAALEGRMEPEDSPELKFKRAASNAATR